MREPSSIIAELDQNRAVFNSLLSQVTKEQITWKAPPDKWCLLEVVCHLHDEECEDFRARTKHVLVAPDQPLPPINPVGWVTERKYMKQNVEEMLGKFIDERTNSIQWLGSLSSPNWNRAYEHPKFGAMSARMFLNNWLAHDYFHFRQITRLKYEHLRAEGGQPLDYAGPW